MSSLINTAMSGLSAAQQLLNSTANNISNYTIAGYNRQTTIISEAQNSFNGNSWYGNGVIVNGVQRRYDALIDSQLRNASAKNSAQSTHYIQLSSIDKQMALEGNTLNDGLATFFDALQNVVNNAADPAARQTVMSQAAALTNQFTNTQARLDQQQRDINTQLRDEVATINRYTQQIATLNQRIAQLSQSGDIPNNLLDQRDQAVRELNEHVGVNVAMQDGSMVVSIANGFTLVNGTKCYELEAVTANADPDQVTIGYRDKNGDKVELPERMFKDGAIGGLLAFRSDELTPLQNRLGQLTLAFVTAINDVQLQGYDLNGEQGESLFTIGQPVVKTNALNQGDATLNAVYTDPQQVQASDYQIVFKEGNWQVTRLSDNHSVQVEADAGDNGTALHFDGLTITVTGTPVENDRYLLQPVKQITHQFALNFTDPNKLAAAEDLSGESDNRNMQKMLDLQSQKWVGGTQTFNQAWGSAVSFIATQTKSYASAADVSAAIITQLTARQQAVSGVNLDEEYANLTHYQQYYIANTQVLNTASALFDALISVRS
ncbi:flagellar hook-associated protein FlgK [Rosenbergiella australiborealis]|uniref:Flagellar hook-associated protein 1 n=1 Tax=Rosenbergiella australiborealis TaxID=1544696 RepID=A0ABS5T2S9_9GAMM|nr:flagellar hook-associated protein FlgK [Rosenbergiella australiborealis]MBT0726626.1 flagellar hook-associated protein FlgK [Rosenbergiella australiborealis]